MAISLPFSLTKKPTYYPAKPFDTLRDALRASERQYSERPAFLQKEKGSWRAYTYAEFLDLTEGLGTELYAQGMGGGTFLVIGENSMEWGCAYLATAGGLGVVVPIDSSVANSFCLSLMLFVMVLKIFVRPIREMTRIKP